MMPFDAGFIPVSVAMRGSSDDNQSVAAEPVWNAHSAPVTGLAFTSIFARRGWKIISSSESPIIIREKADAMIPLQSRRRFLQAGCGLAGSLCVAPWLNAQGNPEPGKLDRIIDTHTHFYDPTRPEGVPFPSPQDEILYRKTMPSDFVKVAGPQGVTGTVVVEASPWLEDNQWLLDVAEENPVVLGVIGNLDVTSSDFSTHLKRFAGHPLYKGVRINTPFDQQGEEKRFLSRMKQLADAGMVVDVNGSAGGVIEILELARHVPDLRIVIEHLPRTPSQDPELRRREQDALREVAALPQVYAKVSYVLKMGIPDVSRNVSDYREELDSLWSLFGADKIFYGSNWPVSGHVCPYEEILGIMKEYLAERTPADAEKYFWGNARVAYRLSEKTSRKGLTDG